MSRILIVEDNESLARGLRSNLEFEGHEVDVAATATDGLHRARAGGHDLIILDLMLPDGDGYRVLRALREAGQETPVLILSALGEEADKVRGFRFGADDYVAKPFGLLELIARVEALLRRVRPREVPGSVLPQHVQSGDLAIDIGGRRVLRRGREVPLRPREFDLLVALVRRHGELVPRVDLLRDVWGYDDSVVSRTVDTHVAELRRKLEDDPTNPRYIVTVLKGGYRWGERVGG
ncbi:MAG: response regulator transcription factor [Gemmatimonadaceae bacterium]|nr:response regulator transcription factor [Gemmatimonadaceae bacterium]